MSLSGVKQGSSISEFVQCRIEKQKLPPRILELKEDPLRNLTRRETQKMLAS